MRQPPPSGRNQAETQTGSAVAMDIDFLLEDDAWLAVPEPLARRAILAVFEVLERPVPQAELSIVFTSDAAVAELNRTSRAKTQPTNVLSFPAAAGPVRAPGAPQPGVPQSLGDIVLAAGVVSAEANAQGKPLANPITHLIVHGVLHLLG